MKRVLIIDRLEPSFTSIENRNLDLTLKFISTDPQSTNETEPKNYSRKIEYITDSDRAQLQRYGEIPDTTSFSYDLAARTILKVEVWAKEKEEKQETEQETEEPKEEKESTTDTKDNEESPKDTPQKEEKSKDQKLAEKEKPKPKKETKKQQQSRGLNNPHEAEKEKAKRVVLTTDPILIGKGTIDLSLKAEGTPVNISPVRSIKSPAPYVKPPSTIGEWKRPADYVPPKSKKQKGKDTQENEEAKLKALKQKNEEERIKKLNDALDHRYANFNAKLYIYIRTEKTEQQTRTKLERTQEVLFQDNDKDQESKDKIQQLAEEEAQNLYDSFIKSEFKVFLQNKKILEKIRQESQINDEEEEQ